MQAALDSIMQGASSPRAVAADLSTAITGFALPHSVDDALAQLSSTQAKLSGIPDTDGFALDAGTALVQLQGMKSRR
jgi:hypothetical protein